MLTAKGFFVDELSVIDMHRVLRIWWTSLIPSQTHRLCSYQYYLVSLRLVNSAVTILRGQRWDVISSPALADGWNYALTLAQGKIQYWNVFGLEIEKVGYQGTVIPTLVSAWVLATLEKTFRKFVPSYLDNLITPLFSLFIAGFLAFTVIGPIGREAGSLIASGLTWLYDTLGFVGGAIFGAFYAPIVITGMHQTFIAV